MRKLAFAFIVLCLACPGLALGQEAQPVKVPEVVVTASKLPQTPGNVTQKVSIITQADMESMIPAKNNLAEFLTYEPGVSVNVLSRNDANWGSSGGIGPKYNTYMLDGLPIDSFVDSMSLDAWAIERIETQKGPASVLYPNYLSQDFAGNQSPLAGTTNFILKERVDKAQTRLLGGYGSYNTWDGRIYHQNKVDNFHFFLGADYQSSDYTNYGTNPSWLNMTQDPAYTKTKAYARGTYFIDGNDRHKLSFFGHQTWHDGDAGRPNRDFDHKYSTAQASYLWGVKDSLTAQAKLGYRNYDRRWSEDNYPPSFAKRETDGVKQEIVPGDVSLSWAHAGGGLLTLGGDFQFANYKTYAETSGTATLNDAKASNLGLYAQEEFTLDRWVLRLGGRFNQTRNQYDLVSGFTPQDKDQTWSKGLWSAGVRFNACESLSLFTNAGSSFMAPAAKQVAGTLNASDRGVSGKNGQLPNPDLEPEEGLGADLGLDWKIVKGLDFSLRGFYNVIDKAIVDQRVSDNPSQSQSVNAGKVTSYGFEVGAKQRLTTWLRVFANYTYTKSKNEDDKNADQDGSEVPFVPEHMGNIGALMDLPWAVKANVYLHVSGQIYDSLSQSGRQKFDTYELLNAKFSKTVYNQDSLQMNLHLDFYNILDKKFEMPWQFQDPGFTTWAGIELLF